MKDNLCEHIPFNVAITNHDKCCIWYMNYNSTYHTLDSMDVMPYLLGALLYLMHKADVPMKYKLVQLTNKQLIITQLIIYLL